MLFPVFLMEVALWLQRSHASVAAIGGRMFSRSPRRGVGDNQTRMSGTEDTLFGWRRIHRTSPRQFIHIGGRPGRRVIHNAAALASGGPLRSIMDNVGNGIRFEALPCAVGLGIRAIAFHRLR